MDYFAHLLPTHDPANPVLLVGGGEVAERRPRACCWMPVPSSPWVAPELDPRAGGTGCQQQHQVAQPGGCAAWRLSKWLGGGRHPIGAR